MSQLTPQKKDNTSQHKHSFVTRAHSVVSCVSFQPIEAETIRQNPSLREVETDVSGVMCLSKQHNTTRIAVSHFRT